MSAIQTIRLDRTQAVLTQNDFIIITLSVSFGWLIVNLLQKFIDNFNYNTLGLNPASTFHALLVAAVFISAFFLTIWVINVYNVVPGGIESALEPDRPTHVPDETSNSSTTRV